MLIVVVFHCVSNGPTAIIYFLASSWNRKRILLGDFLFLTALELLTLFELFMLTKDCKWKIIRFQLQVNHSQFTSIIKGFRKRKLKAVDKRSHSISFRCLKCYLSSLMSYFKNQFTRWWQSFELIVNLSKGIAYEEYIKESQANYSVNI